MDALPAHMRPERSFQGFILALQRFWAEQGCVILQPYDMPRLLNYIVAIYLIFVGLVGLGVLKMFKF